MVLRSSKDPRVYYVVKILGTSEFTQLNKIYYRSVTIISKHQNFIIDLNKINPIIEIFYVT